MKKLIGIILIVCMIFSVLLCGCGGTDQASTTETENSAANQNSTVNEAAPEKNSVSDNKAYGNSAGNIANGGIVCQQGDWIYFQNVFDNYKLYKMHTDGSGRVKLSDDATCDINVIGDWIYYGKPSMQGIYKIRTDGSGGIKLSEDPAWFINVVGDWIYYVNGSIGEVCKLRTDGSGRTVLSHGYSNFINVVDDWIYYKDSEDYYYLYKMRTDGSTKTKLSTDNIANFNVVGEWIYYHYEYSPYYTLYKMRTDGSSRTKMGNQGSPSEVSVAGDWIYTSDFFKKRNYRTHTDGSGMQNVN